MTTLEIWLFIIIGVSLLEIGGTASRAYNASIALSRRLAEVEERLEEEEACRPHVHDFDECGYCSPCGKFADEIGRPERLAAAERRIQKAAAPTAGLQAGQGGPGGGQAPWRARPTDSAVGGDDPRRF